MPMEVLGSLVSKSTTVGTRRGYTLQLSILIHAVLLAILVGAPLVATGVLPSPGSLMVFATAAPAPPPAPPVSRPIAPTTITTPLNPDIVPVEAPRGITEEPPPASLARQAGVAEGVPAVLPNTARSLAPPPPLALPAFVRPGGDIKEPRKIVDVRPTYPAVALAARIEGRVIIEATISRDGSVVDATILRSEPLLDQAALDAVRQWKFTPTLLNGVPVEVKMTVTVNFTLR